MSGIGHLIVEKEYNIYGKTGNFNKILCSDITVGNFNAGVLIASDVVFSSFTANVLNADTATINVLNTSDIYAGNGFFSNDVIINGSLYASNIVISDASYNTVTVSDGNIAILNTQTINNSSDINTFTLNVTDMLTATNLRVNNDLYVENNFSADDITTSDIRAGNAIIDNDTTTLFLRVSDTGYFTNLKTSDMDAGYIGTDTLVVDFKLDALRGDFIEMNALTGDVETLTAHTIVTSDIKTDTATIGTLSVSDISTNLLTVDSLIVQSDAVIRTLNVTTTTTSPTVNSNQINTLSLLSTSDITTSMGYIDTLRASDIFVENIRMAGLFASDIVTGGLQVDKCFKLKNLDNTTTSYLSSNNIANSFFQLPSMLLTSDTIMCNDTIATVTNKILTDTSNNIAAKGLHSTLGIVDNSASTPVLGNVLAITNTSPLTADWVMSSGASVINSSDIINDPINPGQLILTTPGLLTPGVYGGQADSATFVVDQKGRIQQIGNNTILINGGTQILPNTVDTLKLVNNTITTAKIGTGQVTSVKMSNTGVTVGAYTNPNLSVDEAGRITSIVSGSGSSVLNSSDIQNDLALPGRLKLTNTNVVQGSYGTASSVGTLFITSGGKVETAVNTPILINGGSQITANTITGNRLVNSTITSTQLANSSVTSGKLANNAVTTASITDGAVTSAKLANSGITPAIYSGITFNAQGIATFATTVSNTGRMLWNWSGSNPIINDTFQSLNNGSAGNNWMYAYSPNIALPYTPSNSRFVICIKQSSFILTRYDLQFRIVRDFDNVIVGTTKTITGSQLETSFALQGGTPASQPINCSFYLAYDTTGITEQAYRFEVRYVAAAVNSDYVITGLGFLQF
jgi:hypothetical protein